jgi:hypothetical protein
MSILNEDNALNYENCNINLGDDIIYYEIIKQLKNYTFNSFNCLLVDKRWSQMVVSFLWKNPFQLCKSKKGFHLIIETFIANFNDEEREIFKSLLGIDRRNLGLNAPDHQTTFFEYGKYLKEFKLREVKIGIRAWACNSKYKLNFIYRDFEKCIIYSIIRQCQKLECIDWNVLFFDKILWEALQPKIVDLKYLRLFYDKSDIKIYTADNMRIRINGVNLFRSMDGRSKVEP